MPGKEGRGTTSMPGKWGGGGLRQCQVKGVGGKLRQCQVNGGGWRLKQCQVKGGVGAYINAR